MELDEQQILRGALIDWVCSMIIVAVSPLILAWLTS